MVERRLPLRAATALAVAAAALPVGVGLSQTVPLPGAATDDEKALALRTALEAAGLPADTVPRMVKSNGRVSDPRTIGVYLTAPDAELGGRTADLIVEVRFEPRLHVHRISWHGRGGNRAVEPTPASDAYAQARAYAAQRCEFWNERHAVLVRAAVWDGDPGQRPVCDAEFTWEIESSGLASGECYVGLNGSPLLPTLYQTYMNPFAASSAEMMPALGCLPVVEAFCRASEVGSAVVQAIAHQPPRERDEATNPTWGFVLWYTMEGGYLGRTGCCVDAVTGRLTHPETYRDDPGVVGAAERVRGSLPEGPAPSAPGPRAARDDRQAVATAAEFLGLPADALRPRVAWTEGWGGEAQATFSVEVPVTQDVPGHTVEFEVQAGAPYYVRRAECLEPPGLGRPDPRPAFQLWQLAWGFLQQHPQPWLPPLAGESTRLRADWAQRLWYHDTDHLVRTGTWAQVEARGAPAGVTPPLYVSRYEARRAPERSLAEMKVDLLDAVETVRAHVAAQPGAIFLLSYGVPVLSHPASPQRNPAWEIRYFVGPGGPEPIIRWAAVDATDGSLIYVDHALPDTCFEAGI